MGVVVVEVAGDAAFVLGAPNVWLDDFGLGFLAGLDLDMAALDLDVLGLDVFGFDALDFAGCVAVAVVDGAVPFVDSSAAIARCMVRSPALSMSALIKTRRISLTPFRDSESTDAA